MSKLRISLALVTSLLLSMTGNSQTGETKVDMADMMRSNGRIFVVVAVVVVILIGLILYLVRLDKKITRMEKER